MLAPGFCPGVTASGAERDTRRMTNISMNTMTFGGQQPDQLVTVEGRSDEGVLIESRQLITATSREISCAVIYFPDSGEILTYAWDKITRVDTSA